MGKPKPKKVTYTLIARDDEIGAPMYALLDRLVREHHDDLYRTNARIALAFCTSWKPDVDGQVTIGKCRRASDLDRELAAFDFVILLSKTFWFDASEKQRAALVDHELEHAAVKYDANGEPVVDERGRSVFRTRKHDLEEFSAIVDRHGLYKRDLETFARAMDRARSRVPGNAWIGYSSLAARLDHAGLHVPVRRVIDWSEHERRQVYEWLEVRKALISDSADALVPPAPAHVLAAVEQPSVLDEAHAR